MYPNYTNKPSFMTNPSNIAFGASASSFRQPNTSMFSSLQSSDVFKPLNTSSPFNVGISNQPNFGTNIFQQHASPAFSNNNTFGQNKTSFGFGFTDGQSVLFGQQPKQTGSSFLQSNIGNLLGRSNAFGAQVHPDTNIKFSPVIGSDSMQKNGVTQSIRTKLHCIVCMAEYENKSLEELRFEDYSCNKKGPQQNAVFSSNPFGSNNIVSSTLPFSQASSKQSSVQAPSVAQTSTFGQFNSGFGVTHGNDVPSPFGKSIFATTTNAATFGFNSGSNNFVTNQIPKSLCQPLIGNTITQPQTAFGVGIFSSNNTQNNSNNMYQKPTQLKTGFSTGLPSFCFNQTGTTQTSNIFSTLKPTTSVGTVHHMNIGTTSYGQTSQPTGGANFGTITPSVVQSTQSTFNTNLSSRSQQQTMPSNISKPSTPLANTPTGSSSFNNNVFAQAPITLSQNNVIQQQPVQFPPGPPDDLKNISLIATDSFPDGPHIYGLEPILRQTTYSNTNFQFTKVVASDYAKKKDDLLRAKIKMYLPKPKRGNLKEFFDINTTLKTSHKCLVIKKDNKNPSTIFDRYKNDLIEEVKECLKLQKGNEDVASGVANCGNMVSEDDSPGEKMSDRNKTIMFAETPDSTKEEKSFAFNESSSFIPLVASSETNFNTDNGILNDNLIPLEREVNRSPHVESIENSAGVVLTRPEYYMYPDTKDLHYYMNEDGECIVQGLTIGRTGYGNVHFPDPINIADMNFDELVHFRHREVIIYPNEKTKPPVGEGLNRRAQVTLDKIFPREKGTKKYITDINEIIDSNFVDNLIHITQKHGCKFVDYRPKTGSWVFKVKHFSKYTIATKNLEILVSK